MTSSRSVTRWNLLALLVVVLGAALTLVIDRLWLERWASGGTRVPIATRTPVTLPPGRTLVYYQSRVAVPTYASSRLHVIHGNRHGISIERATEQNDFHLNWSGRSGRALWVIDAPAAAQCEMLCFNAGYRADDEVPPDDCIVFAKSPNTLNEAVRAQQIIRFGGGGLTMVLAFGLYVLHFVQMRRPGNPAATSFETVVDTPMEAEETFRMG